MMSGSSGSYAAVDPAATGAALAAADQRQLAGDIAGALLLYDALLARAPAYWPAHVNRGLALAIAGELPSARAGFRRALVIEPAAAPALRNLADSLQHHDPRAGLSVARAFAAAAPAAYEAWLCLGCIELAMKHDVAGRRALRRAIALAPASVDTFIAYSGSSTEPARRWLERAVATAPTPLSLLSLARHLVTRSERAAASRLLRHALALSPADTEPLTEMTAALESFSAAEALVDWARRALLLAPDSAAVWNNLGTAQLNLRCCEDAVRSFTTAIGLRPDLAEAHFNRATPLFLIGRADEAWRDYAWRWRIARFEKPPTPAPRWSGETLADRRLLVHDEQGLGDALQFARYLPALARQGRVTMACDPRLVRLFRASFPGLDIAPRTALPPHDLALPLLDAPRLLGEVPAASYLAAPMPRRIDAGGRLRVGLVWAGNPDHPRDHERSLPPDLLEAWLALPDVAWFSLQVGPPRRDLDRLGVPDLGAGVADLADTAEILAALDLLITVDTAPAHLAGGLGRPVWTLVTWLPDWRWGLNGAETPWYPSMRLFRQKRRGDWRGVVDEVGAALRLALARGALGL
jgi:tetratricopeptide (TPR) repeat protein